MDCWSCSFPMEARRIGEVDHHGCPACEGLVVPILKSLPLWRAMEEARLAEPPAPDDAPVPGACSACRRPVEAFGYQFTDVTVYRCTPCRLLFVPGFQQLAVRNVWRKANDREERQLDRAAAEAAEALASRSPRKGLRAGMPLVQRLATLRGNAAIAAVEAAEVAARMASADLRGEDDD